MISAASLFKHAHSTKLFEELSKISPESANMWKWFLALSEIPRESGNTQAVQAWISEMGAKLGATVKQDKTGNVILSMAATAGKEKCPGVVLQAHTDMVATKTSGSTHNFLKDPILPRIDGKLLKATNTTLGADDGTGVAVALCLLEQEKEFEHGPLQMLFTVDEETGLAGATGLEPGELLSKEMKYLLNVDSEDWGEITVSSAGAGCRTLELPVKREPLPEGYSKVEIDMYDFEGGHSGVQIHEGRMHAGKWAMQLVLYNKLILKGTPLRMLSFTFGNARNAIPSTAFLSFAVPTDKVEEVVAVIKSRHEHLVALSEGIETKKPKADVSSSPIAAGTMAIVDAESRNVFHFLEQTPQGVFRWSSEVNNLVETSENIGLGELTSTGDKFSIHIMARSCVVPFFDGVNSSLRTLSNAMAGTCSQFGRDFGGWPADMESNLLKVAMSSYKNLFGKDPATVYCHAGLECGVIVSKYPELNLQSISIGPTVKNPHTAEELCDIETVGWLLRWVRHMITALVE